MARELGDGYAVIEEGHSGRTTVLDDPVEGVHKNGRTYLLACLESHAPLDLVILMLGTNDLKARFARPASDIPASAGLLVQIIRRSATGRKGKSPKVLLVAPPPIGEVADGQEMFAGAREKSLRFGELYAGVAKQWGCAFLDAGAHVAPSVVDGVHLEPAEHGKLGARWRRRFEGFCSPHGRF
jgi:lysophospholipase L1-like esterase